MTAVDPNFRPSFAQQFNLTAEHEIAPAALVIKTALVGNLGRHLYNTYDANQPIPGAAALNTRRPLYSVAPNVAGVNYFTVNGLSNYYALQVTIDKRMAKGLNGLFGYTWSHAIDNVPLEFGGGSSGPLSAGSTLPRPGARQLHHRHPSPFDSQLSVLVPLRQGKAVPEPWRYNRRRARRLADQRHPGHPDRPAFLSGSADLDNQRHRQPARIPMAARATIPHTLQRWFDPSVFTTPAPYTYGNAGRNVLFGPGRWNWDMSLFKNFVIKDQMRFELRAEAFNVFNHPQFGQPNPNIGNAQVGAITSTVGNPRQLQMGLRFQF